MNQNKTDIYSLNLAGLEKFVTGILNLKRYRFIQLRDWLFKKNALSFDQMTDLSLADRTTMAGALYIPVLSCSKELVSEDGTRKMLFELEDGNRIETVLIPDDDRNTLCVSTQAGCKMGCVFCRTGALGYRRNLTAGEITGQIIAARNRFPGISNLVFMGMGEPMDNLTNLAVSLDQVCNPNAMEFSPRRVTVSTSGLIPEMLEFGRQFPLISLAVSLNAVTDESRSAIMPINRKYPLAKLIEALHAYPLPRRKKITIEYVMIKGINDSPEDAARLIRLLSGLRTKINLILLNESPLANFKPAPMEAALRFQKILLDASMSTTIRKSKGSDIFAACGQLAGTPDSC